MKKLPWLIIVCCLSKPSFATVNQSTVDKISSYLSSLTVFIADFSQENINGYTAHGKLLVEKPSKFRCNYYPPYPLVITGNSKYVAIYDYEMEQLTKIPTSDSGFAFLLSHTSALQDNFKIIATSEDNNFLKLVAEALEHEFSTEIILSKDPLELRSIKINEANGYSIDLRISRIAKVSHIKPELFTVKNPEIFGPPQRLDANSITKYYNE